MAEPQEQQDHPVWAVYDLRRTALLNAKYYSARINAFETRSLWMEFCLAIPASSTLAGLWVWTTPAGKVFWTALGILTALLAIAKPLLKITEKIRRMEKVFAGYSSLEHDLYKLGLQIEHAKAYTAEHQKRFWEAIDRKGVLVKEQIESTIDKALKARLQEEVVAELPLQAFFVPKE